MSSLIGPVNIKMETTVAVLARFVTPLQPVTLAMAGPIGSNPLMPRYCRHSTGTLAHEQLAKVLATLRLEALAAVMVLKAAGIK